MKNSIRIATQPIRHAVNFSRMFEHICIDCGTAHSPQWHLDSTDQAMCDDCYEQWVVRQQERAFGCDGER